MAEKKPPSPYAPPPITGTVPLYDPDISAISAGSGEAAKDIAPSWSDKFWTQSEENFASESIGFYNFAEGEWIDGALVRKAKSMWLETQLESQGVKKISAEEANKLYPDLEVPFSEPVYEAQARSIYDFQKRRRENLAWIGRGPETGLGFDILTGLVTGADPLNLALGGAFGAATKALKLAQTGAKGVAVLFGENFLGNLAGGLPNYLTATEEQRTPPTLGEFTFNAGAGALLGTAIFGAPRLFRQEKLDTAIKQHENGQKIQPDPPIKPNPVQELGAEAFLDYQFRKLGHVSEAAFYVPMDSSGRLVRSKMVTGEGVPGTDNPQIGKQLGTSVIEARIAAEANMLETDLPLSSLIPDKGPEGLEAVSGTVDPKTQQLMKLVEDALSERNPDASKAEVARILKEGTVGDLVVWLSQKEGGDMNKFKELVTSLGYDGLRMTGKLDGVDIDNRVLVYNEDILEYRDQLPSDIDARARLPFEERLEASRQYNEDRSANKDYDPEVERTILDNQSKSAPQKAAEMEPVRDEAYLNAKQELIQRMAEIKETNPKLHDELAKEMQDIEDAFSAEMHTSEAAKNLIKCLGGTIV